MINVLIIIFILIVVLIKSRRKDLKFKNKKIKYVSLFLHASIIVYIFLIFFRLLGNGISKFYDTYFELAIVSLYIFLLVEQIGVEKNIEEKKMLKKRLIIFIMVIISVLIIYSILKLL